MVLYTAGRTDPVPEMGVSKLSWSIELGKKFRLTHPGSYCSKKTGKMPSLYGAKLWGFTDLSFATRVSDEREQLFPLKEISCMGRFPTFRFRRGSYVAAFAFKTPALPGSPLLPR
jgi:hypothetical protein